MATKARLLASTTPHVHETSTLVDMSTPPVEHDIMAMADDAIAAVFAAVVNSSGMPAADVAKAARSVKGPDAKVADDRLAAVEMAVQRYVDRKTESRTLQTNSLGAKIGRELGTSLDRLHDAADTAKDVVAISPLSIAMAISAKFPKKSRKSWPYMGTKLPKEGEAGSNEPTEQYRIGEGKTSTVAADIYDALHIGQVTTKRLELLDSLKSDTDTATLQEVAKELGETVRRVANSPTDIRKTISKKRTDGITRTRVAIKFLQNRDMVSEMFDVDVMFVDGTADATIAAARRLPIRLAWMTTDEDGKRITGGTSEAIDIVKFTRFNLSKAKAILDNDTTGAITPILALNKSVGRGTGNNTKNAIKVRTVEHADTAIAELCAWLETEKAKAALTKFLSGEGKDGNIKSLSDLIDHLQIVHEPFAEGERKRNAETLRAAQNKARGE